MLRRNGPQSRECV